MTYTTYFAILFATLSVYLTWKLWTYTDVNTEQQKEIKYLNNRLKDLVAETKPKEDAAVVYKVANAREYVDSFFQHFSGLLFTTQAPLKLEGTDPFTNRHYIKHKDIDNTSYSLLSSARNKYIELQEKYYALEHKTKEKTNGKNVRTSNGPRVGKKSGTGTRVSTSKFM